MDLGAGEDWMSSAVSTGTTIIGVKYNGGVILGADTRTTTGTYVANRSSDKITAITDNAFVCRSGSAADTQLVSDYSRHFLSQYEMEFGGPPDVDTVATVIMQLNYNNKSMLQAGMIVGGWDKYEGASIFALPIGGTKIKVPFATGGSGSTYIFGFCDSTWKPDMSAEEAEAFVVQAVALAIARDGGSGGCCRIVRIDKSGSARSFYPPDKLPLFYEEIAANAPNPPMAL